MTNEQLHQKFQSAITGITTAKGINPTRITEISSSGECIYVELDDNRIFECCLKELPRSVINPDTCDRDTILLKGRVPYRTSFYASLPNNKHDQ